MITTLKKSVYKSILLLVCWNVILIFFLFLFNKLNTVLVLQMDNISNFIYQVSKNSFYCLLTIIIFFICTGFYRKDWLHIVKSVHVEWAVAKYFQSEIYLKIQVNLTKNDCFIVIQDFETFEQEKTFVQIETAVRNKFAKLLKEYTLSPNFEYRDNQYCLEGIKIV